jgi:hypothetical protein
MPDARFHRLLAITTAGSADLGLGRRLVADRLREATRHRLDVVYLLTTSLVTQGEPDHERTDPR